jgi:glucokinase
MPTPRKATLAIDIGGTSTKLGIVAADDPGRVAYATSVATPVGGAARSLLDRVGAAGRQLIQEAAGAGLATGAVGVSVAGFIDEARERMVYNANLGELSAAPLKQEIETLFRLPATLEVDSNAAAWGEHRYGAGRGRSRMMMLTIGTGVGGGVVCDGVLQRFTGGCAGDMGHVIVEPGGRRCSCGAHGCLEALIGSDGLSERAGGRDVRAVIEAAHAGEPDAVAVMTETGRLLGLGLASLAHIFAPQLIIIGGGISTAGDHLLAPTRQSFLAECAPFFSDGVELEQALLGNAAGMVGVADIANCASPEGRAG